ncbi:hypothetical protein HUN08_00800 [Gordonia sp. X0973]|uniref:hypothetical protein n=1 Tax=Gordonia sp. X0973 TaxID=2742602 RepID=UPI000F540BE3|nr:hypothetical protein [Gordonia sp. X0973]QKT05893.1 hypothetical protein HUN08_00800 [Gordonia sp. X0973]
MDAKDVPALDMSRAEVWRTINENLHVVDPDWVVTPWPESRVLRYGCATNPDNLMSMGPPWKYEVTRWVDDPSAEHIAMVRAGLDDLARYGFTVAPPPRPDDPRDLTAKDARGFTVVVTYETEGSTTSRVDVRSLSPCVRHPGEVDDWPR